MVVPIFPSLPPPPGPPPLSQVVPTLVVVYVGHVCGCPDLESLVLSNRYTNDKASHSRGSVFSIQKNAFSLIYCISLRNTYICFYIHFIYIYLHLCSIYPHILKHVFIYNTNGSLRQPASSISAIWVRNGCGSAVWAGRAAPSCASKLTGWLRGFPPGGGFWRPPPCSL